MGTRDILINVTGCLKYEIKKSLIYWANIVKYAQILGFFGGSRDISQYNPALYLRLRKNIKKIQVRETLMILIQMHFH